MKPTLYNVMLNVKMTKIVNIPGMPQHFAFGVCQAE
jgi:hypothetical protein